VLLADAVDRLPPDHREAFVLRTLEHVPFEEVAARMGRSIGAVRMLWARAVQKLNQMLAEGDMRRGGPPVSERGATSRRLDRRRACPRARNLSSAVERGQAVDLDHLAAGHPAIAEELRSCLEILRLAGRVEGEAGAVPAVEGMQDRTTVSMLGDFRILRQVGRGGMGVVYEAEQVSLHRQVALRCCRSSRPSIPPIASVSDRGPGRGPVASHQHRAGLLGRLRAGASTTAMQYSRARRWPP